MLKRLRTAHPILYCILSEVLFLGSMVVFSLLAPSGWQRQARILTPWTAIW